MKDARPTTVAAWCARISAARAFSAALAYCVLQFLPHTVAAKDYEMPELPGTITVSDRWFPIDKEIVKEWNDELSKRRPNNSSLYLTGFTKGAKATRFKNGPPADPARLNTYQYIWVMYLRGSITTPESVANSIRQMPAAVAGKDFSKEPVTHDRAKSMAFNATSWNPKLLAAVLDWEMEALDGSRWPVRQYVLPIRTGAIVVQVYSTKEKSREDFEQTQEIVSTLKLRDEESVRFPSQWYATLAKAIEAK